MGRCDVKPGVQRNQRSRPGHWLWGQNGEEDRLRSRLSVWEKMARVGAWRTDELTHMRPERLGSLRGVSESERLTFKVCVDKGRVWPWM